MTTLSSSQENRLSNLTLLYKDFKLDDFPILFFSNLQENRSSIPKSQPLTRLHMHTLAYQIVMVSVTSDWIDSDVAAARASLIANLYVCDTPQVGFHYLLPHHISDRPTICNFVSNFIVNLCIRLI